MQEVENFRESFSFSSEGYLPLPEKYEVPENLLYKYMQWRLAKYYGLKPGEAARMLEIDFWHMVKFEGLEQAKNLYLLKLKET